MIAPLSVRMNPVERAEARKKARALAVPESEFARIAMAEFDVEAATNKARMSCHVEPDASADGDEAVA